MVAQPTPQLPAEPPVDAQQPAGPVRSVAQAGGNGVHALHRDLQMRFRDPAGAPRFAASALVTVPIALAGIAVLVPVVVVAAGLARIGRPAGAGGDVSAALASLARASGATIHALAVKPAGAIRR